MADKEQMWRLFINKLPDDLPDGDGPPQMESIPKRKPASKKFLVQKIITEIYVYTDMNQQAFSEITFQDLHILGEMSEAKLQRLLRAEAHKRNKEVDTE